MVKKLNFKKILIIILLAAALFAATYPFKQANNSNEGGTKLSFGWQPTPDEHSCEQSDFGWPFVANYHNPECGIMYINHFADALDFAVIPAVYIPLAALIVYGIELGKQRLTT